MFSIFNFPHIVQPYYRNTTYTYSGHHTCTVRTLEMGGGWQALV